MLTLYPSNKIEPLATILSALIKSAERGSVFEADTVLIQSQGMKTWLQQQVAEHLGIAAQMEMRLPAAFFWRLTQKLVPTEKQKEAHVTPLFEKAALRWEIYRLLPECLDEAEFAPLKTYLANLSKQAGRENLAPSELELFRLADTLADIYDGYQNYRPDWIERWESADETPVLQGREHSDANHQSMLAWQRSLWRKLYPDMAFSERRHRPRQIRRLIETLRSENFDQSALPATLYVFGFSALPITWLPVFELLAKHIDIHFLYQNPCRQYWGENFGRTQSLRVQLDLMMDGASPDDLDLLALDASLQSSLLGNVLLGNLGKQGRDYFSSLIELEESQESVQNFVSDLFVDFAVEDEPTVLQALQQSVLDDTQTQQTLNSKDRSIVFAACHSRVRELEALKDYLLERFDQDPSFSPRDVIVMMPNVDDYAPYVRAVFGEAITNAHGQAVRLPVAIADQSQNFEPELAALLSDILSLNRLKISAEQVLAWLEVSAIQGRWQIDGSDLAELRRWFERLNVRWGLDQRHRDEVSGERLGERMGERTSERTSERTGEKSGEGSQLSSNGSERAAPQSWLMASRRILTGWLVGEQESFHWGEQGFSPMALDSQEHFQLLGKLLDFLSAIEKSLSIIRERHTPHDWITRIGDLFDLWFDLDAVDDKFKAWLTQWPEIMAEQFSGQNDSTDEPTSSIGFELMREVIQASIEEQGVSQRFLSGRINFCTLMPMRSIPFKQVCLLGMNQNDYPRQVSKSSFDLLASAPVRKGDRSRRDEDRYLFLESLLSAREALYISYLGRHAKDNNERFPSLVVSELQDVLRESFGLESGEDVIEHLTTEHRLQSFHPAYFDEQDAARFTYSSQWLGMHQENTAADANALCESSIELTSFDDESDENERLDDWLNAFSHPLKYYYRKRLGLLPAQLETPLAEVEDFAAQGTVYWRLADSILKDALGGGLFGKLYGGSPSHVDQPLAPEQILGQYAEHWQRADLFPAGAWSKQAQQDCLALVAPYLACLQRIHPKALSVALPLSQGHLLESHVLEGVVHGSRAGLVHLSLAGTPGAQFFGIWALHVLWNAQTVLRPELCSDIPRASLCLTSEGCWVLEALPQATAQGYLADLVALFENLKTAPLSFMPKTAFAQLSAPEKLGKAIEAWQGGAMSAGEEGDWVWQRFSSLSSATEDASQSVSIHEGIPEFLEILPPDQIRFLQGSEDQEGGLSFTKWGDLDIDHMLTFVRNRADTEAEQGAAE